MFLRKKEDNNNNKL